VRTWALKGQTPVIQFHFNWNHVSVIAGLSRSNYLFRLYEGSVKKEQVDVSAVGMSYLHYFGTVNTDSTYIS
jgi:hypothetical protein